MFAVVGHVQHAAVGQHRAHPGNRRWLNIGALHTQLRQRLFNCRAIGVRRSEREAASRVNINKPFFILSPFVQHSRPRVVLLMKLSQTLGRHVGVYLRGGEIAVS